MDCTQMSRYLLLPVSCDPRALTGSAGPVPGHIRVSGDTGGETEARSIYTGASGQQVSG